MRLRAILHGLTLAVDDLYLGAMVDSGISIAGVDCSNIIVS